MIPHIHFGTRQMNQISIESFINGLEHQNRFEHPSEFVLKFLNCKTDQNVSVSNVTLRVALFTAFIKNVCGN